MPHSLTHDPVESARRYWIEHGWEKAAPGMAAVVSVLRAEQILVGQANELVRPLGLTFARYQVLGTVRNGPMLLGEIGKHLWITAATVTNAVDRLEVDGLIRRLPHPGDGRATLADITAKGRRVFDAAVEELNVSLFGAIPLSHEELYELVGLIGKLRAGVGDVVGVPFPLEAERA